MITTTRKERLLIRWYYLLPSLGMHGLFYIILIAAEWVFLSMLDDLVFHDPGMYIFGLAIMLALIIVWTFIISYLILASRIDLNKKTWSSAAYKARKAKRGRVVQKPRPSAVAAARNARETTRRIPTGLPRRPRALPGRWASRYLTPNVHGASRLQRR